MSARRDALGRTPSPRRHYQGGGFTAPADLPQIVNLAIEAWGEPNARLSKRDDVRWGAEGSKSVNPRANTWFDHEANEGGGYFDLLCKVQCQPQQEHRSNGHRERARDDNGKLPPWQDIATTYDYRDAAGLDSGSADQTARTAGNGASRTFPAMTAFSTDSPACARPATRRCGSARARRMPTSNMEPLV